MMGYSRNCPDLTTFWRNSQCVPCGLKAGYEVSPNCGFDDKGGRHEPPFRACKDNTYNPGRWAKCAPCGSCPTGHSTVSPCSATTDTQCRDTRTHTTEVPYKIQAIRESTNPTNKASKTSLLPEHPNPLHWAVPLVILISIALVVLSAVLIYTRRRRGQGRVLAYDRRSSYTNAGFSSLSTPPDNSDVLSPAILSAPLQTVLDNLDVLEELVILLDPEIHGLKNTKHLASHCSFPSTWITYSYSMKDSKSPLKAVLEGVTSRHPEWTVGHLAKMFRLMERNDAIAALAKLRPSQMDV
ncbi:IGF-like family receptor 1 isoform X2 [Acanthopagrus latus]|uniref:IGF-like family receptor 1 isoform X2 n=1 Tax=Acanthopagrus latus TaxID=8177 RepID=UPI00187CDD47|nr:IGF-like family receptor 1 isoform X2 [Acanthopagrus latus]